MTEAHWRLLIFFGLFLLFALWEFCLPRRPNPQARGRRWLRHFSLQFINAISLRLLFPGAAVGVAVWQAEMGLGLLPRLSLPAWVAAVLGFLALDLAIYVQHRLAHRWHWLWRLHRMHHSDTQLDASSALRFHPFEIILSMLWKSLVILLLGVPAIAVFCFEVILNGTALFNHSNIRLAEPVDYWLRKLLVTPDMHRVHHSIRREETNSNFGFNLVIWDHLFGSYRAQPQDGHDKMTIGLSEFREADDNRLGALLRQPWVSDKVTRI